jgi:hypothetical protein
MIILVNKILFLPQGKFAGRTIFLREKFNDSAESSLGRHAIYTNDKNKLPQGKNIYSLHILFVPVI